jgi:hypothetical protein
MGSGMAGGAWHNLTSGIDDFTAKEMGAEMIVHYGHSCLRRIERGVGYQWRSQQRRRAFSTWSEIQELVTRQAFQRAVIGAETAETGGKVPISLDPSSEGHKQAADATMEDLPTRLALVSTIQFVAAVHFVLSSPDSDVLLPHLRDHSILRFIDILVFQGRQGCFQSGSKRLDGRDKLNRRYKGSRR